MNRKTVLLALINVSLAAWLFRSPAFSQNAPELIYETKEHILEGAKKEGKLIVSPGFEESTTPHLIEAFKKKYPFIRDVVWSKPADFRKQLGELIDGKTVVDAFRPAPNVWSQYFSNNLFRKYNYKKIAQNGQLNIPQEMIDDSGVVVWSGSIIGIMAYNANRVSADSLPSGWESCLDVKWNGKFTVDSKPNVLASLAARWGQEKLLDYSRKLK